MPRKPSLNKLLGVTKAKRDFARATGIPTTRSGRKRKLQREMNKAIGCSVVLAVCGIALTGGAVTVIWIA